MDKKEEVCRMRILQTNIDNKNKGGAFWLIYQCGLILHKDGIVFDYLTMDSFDNSVSMNNSCTYSLNLRKNRLLGHLKLPFYVFRILKKNQYEVIHINTDSTWKALLYACPARIAGVRKIIIHAHAKDVDGDKKRIKAILHNLCKDVLNTVTDCRLACSDEAGRWMFGTKKYEIINNGIDLNKYQFDIVKRDEIRQKIGIGEDTFLLGNVGIVSETKNQIILIEILANLTINNVNVKLIIVGKCDDYWRRKLINRAKNLGVEHRLIIFGESNDVSSLLSAMDLMLIPSKTEGFCLSLLEAQANGLKCIISDTIPDEAIVTDNVKKINIKNGIDLWVESIYRYVKENAIMKRNGVLIDPSYDINSVAFMLNKHYK